MLYIREQDNKFILPNEETIRDKSINISNNMKSLVYFLIKDEQIVYIGKTKKGFKRVFEHRKDFDNFSYIEVPESLLDTIETLYIERYKPIMNTNKGSCQDYSLLRNFRIK
jgi:hypothetical protein